MSSTVPPVLWLCGPPCAGKSTTAWAVHQQLLAEDATVAYIADERALAATGIDGWCVDTNGMSVSAAAARVRQVVGQVPAIPRSHDRRL